MVPVSMILSDPRFQDHEVTIDAVDVLYAQLTRDLFAIAKFSFVSTTTLRQDSCSYHRDTIKTDGQWR